MEPFNKWLDDLKGIWIQLEFLFEEYFYEFLGANEEPVLRGIFNDIDNVLELIFTRYPRVNEIFNSQIEIYRIIISIHQIEGMAIRFEELISFLTPIQHLKPCIKPIVDNMRFYLFKYSIWKSYFDQETVLVGVNKFKQLFKAIVISWGQIITISKKIKIHIKEQSMITTHHRKQVICDQIVFPLRGLYQATKMYEVFQKRISTEFWNVNFKIMNFLETNFGMELENEELFNLGRNIFNNPIPRGNFKSVLEIKQQINEIENQLLPNYSSDFQIYIREANQSRVQPSRFGFPDGLMDDEYAKIIKRFNLEPSILNRLKLDRFVGENEFSREEDFLFLMEKSRHIITKLLISLPNTINKTKFKPIIKEILYLIKTEIFFNPNAFYTSRRENFAISNESAAKIINDYFNLKENGYFFDMFGNIPLLPIGFAFLGNKVLVNDISYRIGRDYMTTLMGLLRNIVHSRLSTHRYLVGDPLHGLDEETCRQFNLDDGFTPISKNKIFVANLFDYLAWDEELRTPIMENIEFTSEYDYLALSRQDINLRIELKTFDYIFIDPPFGVETNVTPEEGLIMTKYCLRESYRILKQRGRVCMTLPPLRPVRFREVRETNWGDEIETLIAELGFRINGDFPNLLTKDSRSYITVKKI